MDTSSNPSVIVVSHESALRGIRFARCRYGFLPWERLDARRQRDALARTRVGRTSIDRDELARFGFCGWDDDSEVHVLVPRSAARRSNSGINVTSSSADVPPGLFLTASPNIIVPAPELCFIQCCETLSFVDALALGLELCGTFSMKESPDNGRTATEGAPGYQECEAAMSARGLAKAIVRLPRMYGVNMARKVSSHLLDNARSPMEAILAGMFHLPFAQGGFGIRDMQLNHKIPFGRTAMDASGMPYVICDAYIPSAKTALEYNGRYHDDPQARLHDERKSLGLEALGITMLPLNQDTLRSVDALEAVARIIYKRKGQRYRSRSKNSAVKRIELLNGLRAAFGLKPC